MYDLDMYGAMNQPPMYGSSTYNILTGGRGVRRPTGFEGLNFPGMGGLGAAAQMIAQPYMQSAMNQVGMVPMGLGHDINTYDNFRQMQYVQAQSHAMRVAAQGDRQNFMRSAQGAAVAAGQPWNQENQQLAQTYAGVWGAGASTLALMGPMGEYMLEGMGGRRGSSTLMAKRMMDAGRYQLDPVTGMMGMSSTSVGMAANNMFRTMFAETNINQMRGLTGGDVGALYGALGERGLIRTSMSEMGGFGAQGDIRRAAGMIGLDELNAAARRQGVNVSKGIGALSGGDLDKLGADSSLSNQVRAIDTDRIKRSLQGYTAAVAAMKDIFGDQGQPNAPMPLLMKRLEEMTGGSLGQVDPGKLAGMVRQTYNLAKATGVSMEGVQMMQLDAAGRAQAMGLEPIFAAQATQGGLAYGGALRASGMLANPAWGAMSGIQMQQLDQNLRLQAAGSQVANRLNLALRLQKTVGFEAGSEAAAVAQAIGTGATQYRDAGGNLQSMALNDANFMRIFGQTKGLGANDLRAMLQERGVNREYAVDSQVNEITRRSQGGELGQFFTGRMGFVLNQRLMGKGMGLSAAEAGGISGKVSRKIVSDIAELSDEERTNEDLRNTRFSEIIERNLKGTAAGQKLAAMGDDEKKAWLRVSSTRFFGDVNKSIGRSNFRGHRNFVNAMRAHSEAVFGVSDTLSTQAATDAIVQDAMTPIGRGTALSRFMEMVQHADPGDPESFKKAVAAAAGGVPGDQVTTAMIGPAQAVLKQQAAVEKLQKQVNATTDPTERAALQRQLDTSKRALTTVSGNLRDMGGKMGIAGSSGNALNDVALGTLSAIRDIAASQAKAPGAITQKELESTVKGMAAITDEDRETMKKSRPDLKNAPSHLVDRAIIEKQALAARGKAFWSSDEGEKFRRDVEAYQKGAADTGALVLDDKDALRRLGTRGVDVARELRGGIATMNEFAEKYAGGDMAKFLRGDFAAGVDVDAANKAKSEALAIQKRHGAIAAGVGGRMGAKAPREEAMRLLGLDSDNGLNPKQQAELDEMTGDVTRMRAMAADGTLEKYRTGALPQNAESDRAVKAMGMVEKKNQDEVAAASVKGSVVAAGLLKAFGVDKTTDIDPNLAQLLGSAKGRGMADRLITSQSLLRARAGQAGDPSNTGINAMVGELKAARAKGDAGAEDTKKFYEKYRFDTKDGALTETGKRQLEEFDQATHLQQRSKFLQFGKGRKASTDVEAGRMMGEAVGNLRDGGGGGGGGAGPIAMHGTIGGTLTIVGDKATVDGTMGGTREAARV